MSKTERKRLEKERKEFSDGLRKAGVIVHSNGSVYRDPQDLIRSKTAQDAIKGIKELREAHSH